MLPSGNTRTRPGWRPRRTPTSPITRCSGSTPGSSTSGSPRRAGWWTWAAARDATRIRFADAGFRGRPPSTCPGRCWRSSARRRLRAGVDLLRVEANLCRLGCFPDATFDYALSMFSTLGMIRGRDARRRALAECRRILRPGGRLALHAHNLWLNLRDRQGRAWLIKHAVRSIFTRDELGERRMTYRGIPGHARPPLSLGRAEAIPALAPASGSTRSCRWTRSPPSRSDGRGLATTSEPADGSSSQLASSASGASPSTENGRCWRIGARRAPYKLILAAPRVRRYDERRGITAGGTGSWVLTSRSMKAFP